MRQYLDLLRAVQERGTKRGDRTGTGTTDLFGYQMRIDLNEGFPLLTTKRIFLRGVIYELLWMLRGETNIKYLVDNKVHIWDEWANVEGDLGPVYGKQWRSWEAPGKHVGGPYGSRPIIKIDQITKVIDAIKKNPESRSHIVTAWNPADVDTMALPPCHCFFQFHVADGKLFCQLYQRSADVFLGVPFNIASYALLTMMVAQVTGYKVGEFIHTFGSVHIYRNHEEQVRQQLGREPRPLPTMTLNPEMKNIFEFKYEDFKLTGYDAHPHIAAPVAV